MEISSWIEIILSFIGIHWLCKNDQIRLFLSYWGCNFWWFIHLIDYWKFSQYHADVTLCSMVHSFVYYLSTKNKFLSSCSWARFDGAKKTGYWTATLGGFTQRNWPGSCPSWWSDVCCAIQTFYSINQYWNIWCIIVNMPYSKGCSDSLKHLRFCWQPDCK